jgi:4-alpha-glucanotransferase
MMLCCAAVQLLLGLQSKTRRPSGTAVSTHRFAPDSLAYVASHDTCDSPLGYCENDQVHLNCSYVVLKYDCRSRRSDAIPMLGANKSFSSFH